MAYFVITCGEDGISVTQYDESELLKCLTPNKYGDVEVRGPFFKKIPDIDKGYWHESEGTLIIKGEIMQPRAVEVATKYEL